MKFQEKAVTSWREFLDFKRDSLSDDWVFRGQGNDDPLDNSLQRSRDYFEIDWLDLPGIEEQMIRDFRRRFQGKRDEYLDLDRLYCISVMQHHGSPTRLLDFTWSPYVGAFFALEKAKVQPVLWCINIDWIGSAVRNIVGEDLVRTRWIDDERTDKSFIDMYMKIPPMKFTCLENPIRQNTRLVVQQGIFLCPGDISSPLEENLKALKGWGGRNHVLKILFKFDKEERKLALMELHRMNINRASLFPGLDGFAESMMQLIPLYERMSKKMAGKGGPYAAK